MEGYQSFQQNYDPNLVANDTTDVILFLEIKDKSGSTSLFADEMNIASRELFINELGKSHRKNEIMVKQITFDDVVKHKSGFQKITDVSQDYFDVTPNGLTALYAAVNQGFKHIAAYREDLEKQGVNCKCCVFIVTDGDDNKSTLADQHECKAFVDALRLNEMWANSFNITVMGVNKQLEPVFRQACVNMGLNPDVCLVTVDADPKEIRKVIGVVSQSVSSSSANQGVSF